MTSAQELYVLLVYDNSFATPHIFTDEDEAYRSAHAILRKTWEGYTKSSDKFRIKLGPYPDGAAIEEVEDRLQTVTEEWAVWVSVEPAVVDKGVSP